MKKVVLIASLGTGLEYYDFIIYALLANFISQLFFPHADYLTGLMAAYGIFAVGYFARPLGGIIFGVLADRFGRKKAFSSSMLIMAGSTFLMGVAPTYDNFGIFAALLFLTLRVIQGISYGAELPVSLTFLVEHAHDKSRGGDCGWMLSSITVGVLFGNLVMYLLSYFISDAQILSWGWRIPFILGGMLAIPVYFVRKHTQETPAFKKDSYSKNIFIGLFKHDFKSVLLGLSMLLFPASLVTFMLTLPSYLQGTLGIRSSDVYLILTIGYVWTAFLIPFAGRLSDYIGRKRQLALTVILFIGTAIYLCIGISKFFVR